ncbi:hypothetical protein B6V76_18765 [Thioclava sp. IC9]|nr:hypothetical protein B6V76_18765 [Thioclava sp. IC9]
MSKVLILADLHLDLWMQKHRDPFDDLELENAELLIIAGDLANKPKIRWRPALQLIGQHVDLDRVHIIPGNHDYYDFRLDGDDRLADLAHEAGAHLAQKRVLIHERTRFLCATLWTDFALGPGSVAEKSSRNDWVMNDYRYIRVAGSGYRKARPADTIAKHHEHLVWLRGQLATPFDGETVVVTHHAPHPTALPPGAPLPWCYASDLTALIEEYQPERWLFGHTHHAAEFQVGRTQLKNVSKGYPK